MGLVSSALLTHTILVGEVRPGEHDHNGTDNENTTCEIGPPGSTSKHRWPCQDGGAAHAGTLPPINYRSDIREPCFGNADNQELREHSYANWSVSWGFKSRHPGGANFLFGDGAVHFITEEINHDLYQLLGCRHDGRHIEELP